MLAWTEEYKVGMAELDSQHLMLFGIINQIDINIRAEKAGDLLDDVLGALESYVRYHFASEEVVMQRHGYPGLEGHHRSHMAVSRSLAELSVKALEGADKLAGALKVRKFVIDWLVDHILEEDAAFVTFVEEGKGKP